MDVSHGVPAQQASKGIASHSKLSLAKLVELRRRSRIDRARQLAGNIKTQAQIQRATQLYNQEAARLQLDKQLGSIGQNIPQVARVFHETRLAAMTVAIAEAEREQRDSIQLSGPASATRQRHPAGARRGPRVPSGNLTLDAYTG